MRCRPCFMMVGLLLLFSELALSGTAEEELLKLENAWSAAVINRDQAFLDRLCADEYISTSPDGLTADKRAEIVDLMSGRFKWESAALSDMNVRVYGNAAVVTGLNTLKGIYGDQDISGPYRFTDVFVKRDGRWQVVATHTSRVVGR
jgi:ketosteroid isomerase-like protein